jgi:AraC family transcriptional regulator
MAVASHTLACGDGWFVSDVVCDAGPSDRPFEEQHGDVCIAAVMAGTFQYRSRHGSTLLSSGALLLGNEGQCFECGHEHASGDRCLAFHYAPDEFEAIVASVPGARATRFARPSLPPLPDFVSLFATAEAARDEGDGLELEELSLRVAGVAAASLIDGGRSRARITARDERRVTSALRRIEAQADEPLVLAALAREAGMSRFHFLRTFREVVGLTPHQFVLRTRLHRAAVRLRRSDEPVSTIAFSTGFNDLSTFNHRFRRLIGTSPSEYRARRR